MKKLRVAILFGGRSTEHEVSLLSAQAIVRALDRERFIPVLIGIDKTGRFHLQQEDRLLQSVTDLRKFRLDTSQKEISLRPVPTQALQSSQASMDDDTMSTIDVVFPILHGTYGEDGAIQGLLELAGLPYVGAGILGSAVGMDKDTMKRLLRDASLPIVEFQTIRFHEFSQNPDSVISQLLPLGFPCFIKPANAGSSIGIRKAVDEESLKDALSYAFTFDDKAICEKAIDTREIECAVLGNEDPIASIPGEIVIDHPDGFYSYEAKYVDEIGARLEIPAKIDDKQTKTCQKLAIKAFQTLDCSGMARVDFFLDRKTQTFYLNEINTLPGFTAISMYPKLWQHSGISFQELVSRLLDLAIERHTRRNRLHRSI